MDGTGAFFQIDESGSRMGCRDEDTLDFIDAGVNL